MMKSMQRDKITCSRPEGHPRRGVLLLVVLSMLIIFLMTAVTFVVVARSYRESAKASADLEARTVEVAAEDLLDSSMYDLLRGTLNPNSRLRYHSLLRDMYGDVALRGIVQSSYPVGGNLNTDGTDQQFIELRVLFEGSDLALARAYYNGRVLTMLDGPAQGLSTRIVDYSPPTDTGNANGTIATLRTISFKPSMATMVGANSTIYPQFGDRLIVNEAPFAGTGAGFNDGSGNGPATGKLDMKWDFFGEERELALLPNPVFYHSDLNLNVNSDYPPFPQSGGLHESYDAADYQNMALALVPPNPLMPVQPHDRTSLGGQDNNVSVDNLVLPSFHRPALINYWERRLEEEDGLQPGEIDFNRLAIQMSPVSKEAAIARRAVLRPLPVDHPNFPRIPSLVSGPWDVDNDGDGVPDSVWVDLGYAPIQGPDGRLYKPMFAILVEDQDSKLNINAHGSRDEVLAAKGAASRQVNYPGGVSSRDVPHGLGVGPAEVSLLPLAGDVQTLTQLMSGVSYGGKNYLGRYGVDREPGRRTATGGWEFLSQLQFAGYPLLYQPPQFFNSYNEPFTAYLNLAARQYMSPPDLRGIYPIGVTAFGWPNFAAYMSAPSPAGPLGNAQAGNVPWTAMDSPYELNLLGDGMGGSEANAADAPLTLAEWERIARYYDGDADRLPERLLALLPGLQAGGGVDVLSEARRRSLAARSFHVPVPGTITSRPIEGGTDNVEPFFVRGFRDLLRARIAGENGQNLNSLNMPTVAAAVNAIEEQLLARELVDGTFLDLNRPFGDGRDNDGDGAVDDPEEAFNQKDVMTGPITQVFRPDDLAKPGQLPPARKPYGEPQLLDRTFETDINGDGTFGAADSTDQYLARALKARHIYVLMMTLKDRLFEFNFGGQQDDPIPTGGQKSRWLTARRLAQWSVNVVDFADPDSIMTGFEYDRNPFDGWDVDGDVSTDENADPQSGGENQRDVVWGLERQHLLISEVTAFHDLRLRDSTNDPSGDDREDGDEDLDQFRIPQGSLFVELFAAGNPTNQVMPSELYQYVVDQGQGKWLLDLNKHLPDSAQPVWRLAISTMHAEEENSVRGKLNMKPETTTLQPKQMDVFSGDTQSIDRYVWFSNRDPANVTVPNGNRNEWESDLEWRIFWNANNPDRLGTAIVPAGQYFVVGPRRETYVGSSLVAANENQPGSQVIRIGQQRVGVTGGRHALGQPPMFELDGSPASAKTPYGMIATVGPDVRPEVTDFATAANSTWSRSPQEVGFGVNISEPMPNSPNLNYYPEPDVMAQNFPLRDAYGDEANPDPSEPLRDRPLDIENGANRPLDDFVQIIGTNQNIRTIFLQRLADPTLPWNPLPDGSIDSNFHDDSRPVNPYITVDWLPVDLTIFNGEDRLTGDDQFNSDGEFVADGRTGSLDDVSFSTRERGIASQVGGQHNIWRAISPEILPETDEPAAAAGGDYFRHPLRHSLGYLNSTYGQPTTATTGNDLDYANVGAPLNRPFPWLVWNDRPFISQYELMQVPISEPGRLTFEHSVAEREDEREFYDPNDNQDQARWAVSQAASAERNDGVYGHLLNFYAAQSTPSSPTGVAGRGSGNFYRIFDFTGVKSPFVGTELHLNPLAFQEGPGTELRHPPHNQVSLFREPGRINFNMISSELVYRGILHDNGGTKRHPGPTWNNFVSNRRGYEVQGGQADNMFSLDDEQPTFFANPYRTSTSGRLAPLPTLEREDIDITLLRRQVPELPSSTSSSGFQGGVDAPLFRDSMNSEALYKDTDQHTFFRYQPTQRLGNLMTTRSNVFAVWMTVGLFEMDPVDNSVRQAYAAQNRLVEFNNLYPEGLAIGAEAGSDTGETRRWRAFYLIDRSIPVGFEPGMNHNVDQAVLLRRYLD